jgi:superfamily II DNA or RNA helicase
VSRHCSSGLKMLTVDGSTVATYQTLNSVGRLDKYDPSRFKLVIVDEAHHAAAKSYVVLLPHREVESLCLQGT